jgi:hypothetical protein
MVVYALIDPLQQFPASDQSFPDAYRGGFFEQLCDVYSCHKDFRPLVQFVVELA